MLSRFVLHNHSIFQVSIARRKIVLKRKRVRKRQTRQLIAAANVQGGPLAPDIRGTVRFFIVPGGTLVTVNLSGLPPYQPATASSDPIGPHGFHIHQLGVCEVGNPEDPFLAAGGHWNPDNQPHGNHAGDFPVLFSNNGMAITTFFTNRFAPSQIIGRSVLVHEHPDDYRTEPAGCSGRRLACGVINRVL